MAADEVVPDDSIYACRTCGVFHLTSSKLLFPIFSAQTELAAFIRNELSNWKLEIHEDDGFPQHICKDCVQKFQNILKFKLETLETKENFLYYYALRQNNMIQIKTELEEEGEDQAPEHFAYVDDLSDEYDDTIPFEVPHVPIKEESIGEAAIPDEITTSKVHSKQQLLSCTSQQADQVVQNQQVPLLNPALTVHNTTTDVQQMLPENGCSQTKKEFTDQRLKIKNYNCHLCRKKFSNLNSTQFRYHMLWHKKINKKHIKCTLCFFYCNSRTSLKEHIRVNHTKLRCSICKKLLPQQRMESHMVKYHQNYAAEKASQVNAAFTKESQEHVEEQQTAIRDISDHQFVDAHLYDNNSRFDIQCAQCFQTSFRSITELEQHVREHHCPSTTSTPSFTSPTNSLTVECNKTNCYTNQFYYNTDDEQNQQKLCRIETMDQYTCAKCPAQYARVEDLCEHSKTHSGKTKFTCHLCSKSYKFKFTLNRHLKNHTN